jgi:ABC-type uncharacterized transport system permease subunit
MWQLDAILIASCLYEMADFRTSGRWPFLLKGNIMKNFFSSLVDTSFTKFITRPVASVFYIISMILIGLSVALVMIAGLFLLVSEGDLMSGFIGLVLGPLLGLFTLILLRLLFESSVALVLIAENTKK